MDNMLAQEAARRVVLEEDVVVREESQRGRQHSLEEGRGAL